MYTKQTCLNFNNNYFPSENGVSVAENLTSAELEQISALYSKWLIKDPCSHCACRGGVQYARDPDWIKEHATLDGARMVTAKKFSDIVGFSQFFTESVSFPLFAGSLSERFSHMGKLAYVYLILVEPESYRQGLGKKIYNEVFTECKRLGCEVLLAEIFVCPVPNSSSLRFHEAMGFQYSGQSASHDRQIGAKCISLSYAQLYKIL